MPSNKKTIRKQRISTIHTDKTKEPINQIMNMMSYQLRLLHAYYLLCMDVLLILNINKYCIIKYWTNAVNRHLVRQKWMHFFPIKFYWYKCPYRYLFWMLKTDPKARPKELSSSSPDCGGCGIPSPDHSGNGESHEFCKWNQMKYIVCWFRIL